MADLATVGVLGVDHRLVLLEERFVLGFHGGFGKGVGGEPYDFRFHYAVLVERDDDLLQLAEEEVELGVNVEGVGVVSTTSGCHSFLPITYKNP